MQCPPCKGTGKGWGVYPSDCELCHGEGILPDTRIDMPICHHCNGTGRKEGIYPRLCPKCGGWGRRERKPVAVDPLQPATPTSSSKSVESLVLQLGVRPPPPTPDPQQTIVVQIDAGKPRTAHLEVAKLLQPLMGEVRICDPYYGTGSLLRLDELAKAKAIRFLTQKADSREQTLLPKAIQEFVRERPQFEFRRHGPNDLHDRFIITDDCLILLGHGLKDIGNKDSFVVKLDRGLAADVIDNVRASFDARWLAATPLA